MRGKGKSSLSFLAEKFLLKKQQSEGSSSEILTLYNVWD